MKHRLLNRLQDRLQYRLMAALAAFTLGVSGLFGLFAMAFVYTVEDRFLERLLEKEAVAQRLHLAQHGRFGATGADFIELHPRADTLPAGLQALLAEEPRRREAPGLDGRHYHLLPLGPDGSAPWLVAEVSQQLIVRPMRQELLGWLAGWGLVMVVLSLALARWLARRTSAPLEKLARQVTLAAPERLPLRLAQGTHDDEVGAVASAFDALLDRTRDFIHREQAFTRDASHELRTPLAVLRMGIEGLQRDARLPPALQQQLLPLHAATRLMEQTVHTLLLLAREADSASGSGAAAEPVPVLPLVEDWVLAHADWLDTRQLQLDLQLSRADTLWLPSPVLQLALSSLLGNALAHGRAGGTVQVALNAGDVCIRNPGDPLPAGAGERFVKGEASSGFGLGLAIVRRLLERHGSRLVLVHEQGCTEARIVNPGRPARAAELKVP
ncbi:MAG: histidine kinase dimerization/phospho-acceptor domain-containing protein [Rubrivivax sp.]|nr:histidine kinase dimerization/phospho-acceptor domain-containing protein [Rubrivivax sp.]